MKASKKAISPIIATVLLILIAIATGVIIYAFATGWVGSRISNSGPSSMISIDAASIRSTIETNVYNVTVYVRNIGSSATNISGIYIIDPSTGNILGGNTSTSTFAVGGSASNHDVSLEPNQVKEISCNITATSLKNGYSYQIKVTTTDGSEATTSVVFHKT